jgi:hypothetical protein
MPVLPVDPGEPVFPFHPVKPVAPVGPVVFIPLCPIIPFIPVRPVLPVDPEVKVVVPPEAVVMLEAVSSFTVAEPVQPVVVKVLSVPVPKLSNESFDLTR